MANGKKSKLAKDTAKPTPPPATPEKSEVVADDVAMLELEAEEVLREAPVPIPSTEDTTLRELLDRTNGVLVKLKDAETRAKEAEKRFTEQSAQAAEKRKEADKQIEDAAARQKKADKIVTEYQGYLDKLAEVLLPEKIPVDAIPGELVPPPIESHKAAAHDVVRKFKAAQKKAEDAAEKANTKEKDFERRKSELDKQEKDLIPKKNEHDKREKELSDREAKVAERESNAENDFLVQRRAILNPIESQLAQLRTERDSLVKQMDDSRAADLAEWQKRCAEREQKWRDEDLARAKKDDASRNALSKELEKEREKKLADLRDELEEIRLREQEKREALWAAQDEELQERETKLIEKEKELRRLHNEVRAGTELLDEDREAFVQKVEQFGAARVAALEEELAATKAQLGNAIKVRDQYYRDVVSRQELERQLGGRSPQDLLDSLEALKRERAELKSELDTSLGGEAKQRLELLERTLSSVGEKHDVLQGKLVEAEQRLIAQRTAAVGTDGLRRAKEALETNNKILVQTLDAQEKLLGAKINELRAEVDQYTQADEQRNPFKALLVLDEEPGCKQGAPTISPLETPSSSLKDFVSDLRHRIACAQKGKRLHYSERDIRCFLGGLAMSKLMMLQGISGTGKTSLPDAFARAVGTEAAIVEVQAGWRDRQDLLGYYNAFHRQYYTTNFLQALYKAGTPGFRDRLVFIVLDEINLSRVEQFFADFLSALELPEDRRKITLHSDKVTDMPPALLEDGRHLKIPPNVWFIGTANHDETTTDFAPKTYDRAHIMELPRNRDAFAVSPKPPRASISFQALTKEIQKAQNSEPRKKEVTDVLTWLHNGELATTLDKRFRVGWGNRLERDIERFVPIVKEAGGTVGEALDHLLQTKVFRKLRDRHDVRVKALEDVRDCLKRAWPASFGDDPSRTLDLLEREIQSKQREEEG